MGLGSMAAIKNCHNIIFAAFLLFVLSAAIASCGNDTSDLIVMEATTPATTAPTKLTTPTLPSSPTALPSVTASPTLQPTATTIPPTRTPMPTVTPVILTEQETAAALLTAEDFPPTWTTGGPGSFISVEKSETFSFLCQKMERRAMFTVEANFRDDRGPFLTHAVIVYPPETASNALAAFQEAAATCDEWEASLHFGNPIPMRLIPSSFPEIGDEFLSIRTAAAEPPDAIVFPTDSLFIQHGNSLIFISQVAQNADSVDEALVEQLAHRALEKLDAVLASQ